MLLAYLPSRVVLPSMRRAMPAMPVMAGAYCPPAASQWPSRFWFFASHSSPLLTASLTLGSSSSAPSLEAAKTIHAAQAAPATNRNGFMTAYSSDTGRGGHTFPGRVDDSEG